MKTLKEFCEEFADGVQISIYYANGELVLNDNNVQDDKDIYENFGNITDYSYEIHDNRYVYITLNNVVKHIEITEEEAKELYCKGDKVYITNRMKTMWKMPATHEFASLVPAEQLFYRLISSGGEETTFYKDV